jgi:hypothetical protein
MVTLGKTKALMASLLRMKPKPHEEIKIGKKPAKKSAKKRASSKPKIS